MGTVIAIALCVGLAAVIFRKLILPALRRY